MFSPNNDCAGPIDFVIGGGGPINPQSSCGNDNKDDNHNIVQCKACIGRDGLSLISFNCKCLVYSSREGGDTIVVCFKSVVGTSLEKEANRILKILVKIQGADLRRFDKQKKRATLWTGGVSPSDELYFFFAVHKALKYGWVSIPYHLMLYTNGVAEKLLDLV